MRKKITDFLVYRFAKIALIFVCIFSILEATVSTASLLTGWRPQVPVSSDASYSMFDMSEGIPVSAQLYSGVRDTTIVEHYTAPDSALLIEHGIIPEKNGQLRHAKFQEMPLGEQNFVTKDTTVVQYVALWKDPNLQIKSGVITKMSFMINRGDLGGKLLYFLPSLLSTLLIAWCAWQLSQVLGAIKKGQAFRGSNHHRFLKIGYAMLLVQLVFFMLSYAPHYQNWIIGKVHSTIPDFKAPVDTGGMLESPFSLKWVGVACIILVLATAFRRGDKLQRVNDYTA